MEKLWYVVNTYSGHESKVQEKLLSRAQTMAFQDYIFRVVVPEETVYETLKDGSTSHSGQGEGDPGQGKKGKGKENVSWIYIS